MPAAPARMRTALNRAAATFAPATWDAEKRTIDVIVSTGAAVKRYDWWNGGYYNEELVIAASAIRLDRLNNGAAVLNTHDQYDLGSQIGVVERAWIEAGSLMATLRLSERADVAGICQDIISGIIRNVSVGYQVNAYEKDAAPAGEIPTYRAVDWEPTEVSFVPVPADAGAQARGIPQLFDVEIRVAKPVSPAAPSGEAQEEEMPNEATRGGTDTTAAPAPVTPAAPAVDVAAIRAQATLDERNRQTEIRSAVRAANLPGDFADQLISENMDINGARAAVIGKLAEKQPATTAARATNVSVTRDEGDTRNQGIETALLLRMDPASKVDAPAIEMARGFRHMSLIRMAEDILEAKGANVRGLPPVRIAEMALSRAAGMTTSDFPYLLAAAANKRLRSVYENAPTTYQRWARRAPNAPDFKSMKVINLGAMPGLDLKIEGAAVTFGTISEGQETYQVATYAKGLIFSREAMINDDLRGFDRITSGFAAAARRKENALVYSILTTNGNMADGKALFHTDHANTSGAAAAISVTTLTAGRAAMRVQKGLQNEALNITPAYLIVPATLEQVAYQYTSSQFVPAQASNINEFRAGGRTSLEPIVEPILDASSASVWYLAGDGVACDTVEYCWLDGAEGVYLESELDFDTDGLKVKARLDFGCAVIDHRAFWRNAA